MNNMMKIIDFENTENALTDKTSLQGYVTTDYKTLVKVFGEPTNNGDNGDKVTVEWCLNFFVKNPNGVEVHVPATIYDWKLEGQTPYDEYDWHVGGHNTQALELVSQVLNDRNLR
jgi:hypothetical protein